MNHPTNDELLLLAYDELPRESAGRMESHVATCTDCRRELASLERGRVALDVAIAPRPSRRWLGLGLAAAALLAGILLARSGPSDEPRRAWNPTTEWSATAGYVTGGKAMLDIDAELTRLERGWSYGRP